MSQPSRFPGFDGLRSVAAVSVMFSHAFLIATGNEAREPLVRLLGPGNTAGLHGVFTFFIISGFLLSRSLSTNASAVTYVVNRTLRILPGFLLCTAVTAFVIGPLFSAATTREYFASPVPYTFARWSIESLSGTDLPGLFNYADAKGLATVVNGSLWSLRYEALSYTFLLVVWFVLPSRGLLAFAVSALALVTWLLPTTNFLTSIAFTLPYFAAGVLMHWFHARWGTNGRGAVVAVALLLASTAMGLQRYAFAPLGAYLIVFIGERRNPVSALAEVIGDCSYGLYLYGWPAEQIVKQLTQTTRPLYLFALALPLAFVCALVSCHAAEAPAMRLRGRVASTVNRVVDWLLTRVGAARGYAVVGAKAAFVIVGALVLLSSSRWWFFLTSMRDILVSVAAGGAVAAALYRVTAAVTARTPATDV
jgi:peptidoglycan/LPS O-acetylase OafA/YrhL